MRFEFSVFFFLATFLRLIILLENPCEYPLFFSCLVINEISFLYASRLEHMIRALFARDDTTLILWFSGFAEEKCRYLPQCVFLRYTSNSSIPEGNLFTRTSKNGSMPSFSHSIVKLIDGSMLLRKLQKSST